MPIEQKYFNEADRKAAIKESKRRYVDAHRAKINEYVRVWSKAHYDPAKKRAYYLRKKAEKVEVRPSEIQQL